MKKISTIRLILNGVQKCDRNMHTSWKENMRLGGAISKVSWNRNPNRRCLIHNSQENNTHGH